MSASKPTKGRRRGQARKRSTPKKITTKSVKKSVNADVKAFRKAISTIKRLGLAFSRTDTKKTKPRKRAKNIVEQYRDVLEGRARVHKIGKKGAKEFKAANLPQIRVHGDRIIVPKEEGTTSYVRGGHLYRKRTTPTGAVIHRTRVLPIQIHSTSLQAFIDNLSDNPALEAELRKGNHWAFRFFGNNSYATFEDIGALAYYWASYESIQLTLKESLEQQQEYIEALEIFQLPAGTNMRVYGNGYTRLGGGKRRRSDYAKSLYQRNKIRNPQRHEAELARKREQANERYDKVSKTPEYREQRRAYEKARYAKMTKRKPKK